MAAPVSLIQGASKGIGLQFCQTLLKRSQDATVIATCRNPDTSHHLQKLKVEYPNSLHIIKIDVKQETQIKDAATIVSNHVDKLDMLINCAAILHPSGRGETSLKDVSAQGLLETMATNTAGPLLMAKYFSPLLLNGSGHFGKQNTEGNHGHSAVLVNLSAKVGSITDNGYGGWYSYRMSKAALNMATKNLGIELGRGKQRVLCVALHPGTVETDLSRPYHKYIKHFFTTKYSVDRLLKVIDNLKMEDSGKFFTYDGTEMEY